MYVVEVAVATVATTRFVIVCKFCVTAVKTNVLILVVEVLTNVEVDVNGVNTVKVDVIRGVVVVTAVVIVDVVDVCVVETDIDVVVVVVACWTVRVM